MSDIDPTVKAAVDAWLAEVENFGLRAERVPDGALPWLYEAAMVGAASHRQPGCYTSDRVFDGVRVKTPEEAALHIARLKRFAAEWAARYPKVMAALKSAGKD